MLKIQIVEGHNSIETRNVTNRTTGEIKTYYNQFGYVSLPSSMFPQKMKIPVESPAMAYPVGNYTLDLNSFQIGRFDSLEINGFNIKLLKAQDK